MQGVLRPSKGSHRSIGPVRRAPLPGLLTAILAASALGPAGASAQLLAPPSGTTGTTGPVTPAPAPEPRKRTVSGQLGALRAAGLITTEAHDQSLARYRAAKATTTRLSGRRRTELAAVVRTFERVVERGELTSTRIPLAFETLERNRRWWTTGRLLPYGARIGFAGSELVWQSYPGQGIQVQWLGTWGKANALFAGKTYDARLRALLDEALRFGATRAGGIAFESWFTFDGGSPPWVSALSTGTAMQALSRAGVRLGEPRYLEAARASLGIFRTSPPSGIRLPTAAGAHYLQYSFTSKLRIVNGFVQALNGLHDFGALANDPEGRALFAAGEAQLRAELPRADTGAWSLYSVGGRESDLGYHRLLRDFLRGLCERTADALYCDTATRFTADLTRAPVLALLPTTTRARKGKAPKVAFTLDKISTVSLVAARGGKPVFARTVRFARGRRAIALPRLRATGELAITLRAVDPAGNVGGATGIIER